MDRLRVLTAFLGICFLAACSGTGFSVELLKPTETKEEQSAFLRQFERAEVQVNPWNRPQAKPKNSSIVRGAKLTNFKNIRAQFQGNQIQLVGELEIENKSLGAQGFSGKLRDSEAVLDPQNSELVGKIKAKLICTGEGQNECDEYFIDLFYLKDGKVYADQYVMSVPNASVTRPPSNPATPQPPDDDDNPKNDRYDQQEQFFDEQEADQAGGYVGTSEKEIMDLFGLKSEGATDADSSTPSAPEPVNPKQPPSGAPTNPTPPIKPPPNGGTQPPVVTQPEDVPKDQAIRLPYRGTLQKPTDFLELAQKAAAPFKIMWPQRNRHFGTYDLAEVLTEIGTYARTLIADYKIPISDVSAENGGKVGSHASHQNGLDVDLSYVVKNERKEFVDIVNGGKLNADFMLSEQWKILKYTFQTGMVELIFVDNVIKQALCHQAQQDGDIKDSKDRGAGYQMLRRVKAISGHQNHYHLRIKCSENNPRCRQEVYSLADSGCNFVPAVK